ncbi:hypothetical protein AGMMS50293_07650 [Spirochaetia bacterium]|nr:hypothetical protein AGMMS50293_07650 [Spirochaetia bacterium]
MTINLAETMCEKEGKTILAIDDDPTILTAIRKILETSYDVYLAKSADMAWDILNTTGIDMILLDVEMPGMSGLAFMEHLKENSASYYYYIPVIFVTSHGTSDVITKAITSGAKDFIVKPFSAAVLLEKVAVLFKRSGQNPVRFELLRKLHFLDVACKGGKGIQVEQLVEELSHFRYNIGTDTQINDIRTYARKSEFAAISEKINVLIKNNLFDKK